MDDDDDDEEEGRYEEDTGRRSASCDWTSSRRFLDFFQWQQFACAGGFLLVCFYSDQLDLNLYF